MLLLLALFGFAASAFAAPGDCPSDEVTTLTFQNDGTGPADVEIYPETNPDEWSFYNFTTAFDRYAVRGASMGTRGRGLFFCARAAAAAPCAVRRGGAARPAVRAVRVRGSLCGEASLASGRASGGAGRGVRACVRTRGPDPGAAAGRVRRCGGFPRAGAVYFCEPLLTEIATVLRLAPFTPAAFSFAGRLVAFLRAQHVHLVRL